MCVISVRPAAAAREGGVGDGDSPEAWAWVGAAEQEGCSESRLGLTRRGSSDETPCWGRVRCGGRRDPRRPLPWGDEVELGRAAKCQMVLLRPGPGRELCVEVDLYSC